VDSSYRLKKILSKEFNGNNITIDLEHSLNRIRLEWLDISQRTRSSDPYLRYTSSIPIDYEDQEGDDSEVLKLIKINIKNYNTSFGRARASYAVSDLN